MTFSPINVLTLFITIIHELIQYNQYSLPLKSASKNAKFVCGSAPFCGFILDSDNFRTSVGILAAAERLISESSGGGGGGRGVGGGGDCRGGGRGSGGGGIGDRGAANGTLSVE